MIKSFFKKVTRYEPWDFALLLAIATIAHIPMLVTDIWQTLGDTTYSLEVFYSFYNHFFFHRELARWFPYGVYGIQADYWQLINIAPAAYLSGLIGCLLRIQNAFFVFKLSVLFEQWFVLLGTYLLVSEFFRHRAARFFTCFGIFASAIWINQISWNFHLFYMLPLIFYLIVRWSKTSRPHYLWLAGTTLILYQLGLPIYFLAVNSLAAILFGAAVLCLRPSALRNLFEKSRANFFCFFLMIACAAVYLYFASHVFDHIFTLRVNPHERDPVTHAVYLDDFLTFSPSIDTLGTRKFLGFLFPDFSSLVCTLYMGFLPLVFVLYSCLRVRQKFFYVFAGLTVFFILFSIGKSVPVAEWVYRLYPPMRFYRGIGFIAAILRMFLFILAGFGLDQFLSDRAQKTGETLRTFRLRNPGTLVILCGGTILAFWLGFKIRGPWGAFAVHQDFTFVSVAAVLSVIFVLIKNPRWNSRRMGLFLVLILATELFAYQTLLWNRKYIAWQPVDKEMASVQKLKFQPMRLNMLNAPRRAEKIAKLCTDGLDNEAFNFMQFDKCKMTVYRNWHYSTGLVKVIDEQFMHVLMELVGCNSPKLRLLTSAAYAPNEAIAKMLILTSPDIGRKVVLTEIPREPLPVPGTLPEAGSISVDYFSMNRLRLTVDVWAPRGAWLYYADAFHPGWHTKVDGKPEKVLRANLAFKAVQLAPGKHTVEFFYFDGLRSIAANVLALFGLLFSGVLVFFVFRKLFPFRPKASS
jgi:hypothetical protein